MSLLFVEVKCLSRANESICGDEQQFGQRHTEHIQYNQDNNISSTIHLVMEYGTKKMDWPNN
eukprot:scaffold16368_cov73-Cyclotella_meneghiniana.AAC.7